MARALELAARGQGFVEPNPLVGCVVARGEEIVAEGFHRRFGGPHAEVEALAQAGPRAAGATLYVTLEPCCHHGKTPPCSEAVVAARPARVVVACRDPFPAVSGGGLARLAAAGIQVDVGCLEDQARRLNAPYLKLVERHRPWVIAKWAMSLDGKIATHAGQSRWISGDAARGIVHALRGRVDAILVGRGTVEADDPLLTARPPGPRLATRIVADSLASLADSSKLVRTAGQAPVLVAAGPQAEAANCRRLEAAGCEVFVCQGATPLARLDSLLLELGRRRMTNLLVEGGAKLLGALFDARQIDEVHVFVAPLLVGGAGAPGPLAGQGAARLADAARLDGFQADQVGPDLHLHGRLARS